MPKNLCLQTAVLGKTLESHLDSKEIKLVNLKGNQPWIVSGRTDAEPPVFESPDVNRQLIGKSLMLGKIECRRRRGRQRMRWLGGLTDAKNMNLGKLWEMVRDREAWGVAVHEVAKSKTWLGNWTNKQIIGRSYFLFLNSKLVEWMYVQERMVVSGFWLCVVWLVIEDGVWGGCEAVDEVRAPTV